MPYALLLDIINQLDDVNAETASNILELIAQYGDEREFQCSLDTLWELCKRRRVTNVIGRRSTIENIQIFIQSDLVKKEYKDQAMDVVRADRYDIVLDEDGKIYPSENEYAS